MNFKPLQHMNTGDTIFNEKDSDQQYCVISKMGVYYQQPQYCREGIGNKYVEYTTTMTHQLFQRNILSTYNIQSA